MKQGNGRAILSLDCQRKRKPKGGLKWDRVAQLIGWDADIL